MGKTGIDVRRKLRIRKGQRLGAIQPSGTRGYVQSWSYAANVGPDGFWVTAWGSAVGPILRRDRNIQIKCALPGWNVSRELEFGFYVVGCERRSKLFLNCI